jgi:hypothetical protein
VVSQRATGVALENDRVGDRDEPELKRCLGAGEEVEGVDPDPDVEDRIEADDLAAVVDGAGDHQGPDREPDVERPRRQPSGQQEERDSARIGDRDVRQQRGVVELGRMGQKDRDQPDRRPGDEQEPRRSRHDDRGVTGAAARHARCLDPLRSHAPIVRAGRIGVR